MDKRIIIGQGVGKIKFGMTQAQVESVMGKPDEVEEFTHDDEGKCVTLYYDDAGIDFAFESEDDFKLSHLSVSDEDFNIENKLHVGMTLDDSIAVSKELGFGEFSVEETNDGVSKVTLYEFDEKSLNLWFSQKVLVEMQVGPLWADEETIIWPEL